MFLRLLLIVTFIPLQSCSNSVIGEKLEKSFDTKDKSLVSRNMIEAKEVNKNKEIKKIKLSKIDFDKVNKNTNVNLSKEASISKKDRFSQKSTKSAKSTKKVKFTPQPYRIILKLSGTNPSAPAEAVTNALRKAGVQFEVEKIERFKDKILLKDSSLNSREF
tara:strand:- start:525 stop:1010 length:486 start_codon:yes stop_codon:yes gene_type:complete